VGDIKTLTERYWFGTKLLNYADKKRVGGGITKRHSLPLYYLPLKRFGNKLNTLSLN
jgi:hypothetical protein